ncbi:MAG: cbb3-type cytochrome c oxidase subunit I [Candidatus Nanopelagicales bacterium]|jgi:cytochrome c oxidase subunit I|nr:cbb3-type cytochrome c oxidase subunit I [Candidatus Nanopelagicales bacterium]MDP4974068.1 cbb3-type cytochrome c oxidase subunit I [Candidatus Nanopelagicales bacterium]
MSTDSVSTSLVYQVEVPQPKQHGKPGGLIRHLNFFTGLVSGVVLALVFGFIMNSQFPSGSITANFANAAAGPTFWAMMVGWIIGFLGGMGAFIGPIRWLLGRDLTHADAEFLAGKDQGTFRYWRFTTDHKVVGIQYLIVAMIILGFGGLLAMLIRTELGITWMEVFNPDFYNSLVGTHGIAMVIAMIVIVSGPVGNFIVPLMCGARDMAFPRLNALSIWLLVCAVPPLILSLLVGGIRDGWSVYQPLNSQAGPGMIGYQTTIIVFAVSTALASVNIMTTVLTMRAKGMTWSRTPILIYGAFAAAAMGLYAFPFYMYSQILSMTDRLVNTSFFDPIEGGSVWLYQNLFWLLGHPEVYVILIPSIAVMMELLPVFMRKPLFSYYMAIAGIVGVVGLSGLVWAHHMYMTGWAPQANYPFMLSTEMISIPVGFLVLVVIGTMWRGAFWSRLPMMAIFAVIFNKMIGGVTGVYLSDVPADQYFHGNMFVTAHFHYMLMGAGLFGAMGGIAYYFPKMTGRFLDERTGSIGFWTAFAGFQITFMSMFVAGLQGQPRRVLQFDNLFNLSNWISTIGAYVIGIGMLIFLAAIISSWRSGEIASSNPWQAQTLDWQTATPVPLENFPVLPVVTKLPYDYGVPDPLAPAVLEEKYEEKVGAPS